MNRRYNTPPLIEVLCEFRFDSDVPWDITLIGLLYDKLKEHFPKKQQLQLNFAVAANSSETQFQWLEKLYVFRSNTEVKQTLREYPFLAPLLLDTYSKIEEHFPNSRVFLEVAIDYEDFEEYPQGTDSNKELVISISTSLLPEEAMKTFKEFYDRWWAKASRDAKGKISIGLEFL